jgi:hypothetical protein
MPLVAESAWNVSASHGGDDLFSMSFDLDFPSRAAFIKVAVGEFLLLNGGRPGGVHTGLINMRFRNPDNSVAAVTFPNIGWFSPVYVQFNPTMTHVTVGIMVHNCEASLIWNLGIWA